MKTRMMKLLMAVLMLGMPMLQCEMFAGTIGGGLYQQPTWYLSVINSQTGQIMTSKTVTGSDTTVNISSYSSGLYIVRAINDGNIYSAKFIK